jgi:transposase
MGAAAWYKEEILAMLCWIAILGGVLIMMGQHSRSEALFYYFRLEEQVPETHLLRLIDKHISLAFVREKLKESYSDTGRPSIDPELLLRILLIGYLYGITSERKLVEALRMHLAWRWSTGLGFDQEIPHHSTFSKNRHGRFQESKLFEQLFEEIVARCGSYFSSRILFGKANSTQKTCAVYQKTSSATFASTRENLKLEIDPRQSMSVIESNLPSAFVAPTPPAILSW